MRETVICEACGRPFEPSGTRDKYCHECRGPARAEKSMMHKRMKRAEVRETEKTIHFCDPPENIEKCLECQVPPEECHGTCFLPGRRRGRK